MSDAMELSHTHFRQMKKHLANIEKAWGECALVMVKEQLGELDQMSREVETVIKNQLYFTLKETLQGVNYKESEEAATTLMKERKNGRDD